MEWQTLQAIVAEGGGYDHIAQLIFDNAIIAAGKGTKIKEEDFVQLGGTWCYRRKFKMRNNKTYQYTEEVASYHPLEHLQCVVMGDPKNLTVDDINIMTY